MSEDRVRLHEVAWNEVFPWLMIVRVFSLATSMSVLFLATAGVVLIPLGWLVGELFLTQQDRTEMLARTIEANHAWPGQTQGWEEIVSYPGVFPGQVSMMSGPMQHVYVKAVEPFAYLLRNEITWSQTAYFVIGGLWTLLIWSLFGGAITRIAVVKLGREEREGMVEAVGFAARRIGSYFAAPLFPLLGILVVCILALPVGWLMHWDAGVILAGLLWGFVLLGGLMMAILLMGLLFGWPLMWGAISTEEMGDVFEAAQRCYSYTFGRPLRYLFYAFLVLVLGSAGFLLVQYFAEGVVQLGYWSVSWGSGADRLDQIATAESGTLLVGNLIIQFFNGLVLTVASAFRHGFFWSAAAAIYLLLRHDVDQTELDDVYVKDEHQRYGLPKLVTDDAGVPGVDAGNGA